MLKTIALSVILMSAALVLMSCSQASPVDVNLQQGLAYSDATDGHVLLAYYQFYMDPATGTVDVMPLRLVEMHKNVKPFLLPPSCSDCLIVQVTGPYKNNILPLNVSIKNPTALTGYDVRGILISNDEGAYLNNPDNYTDLFDDGGPITINPFMAYATAIPDRSFAPGVTHSAIYNIFLSKFGKVAVIDYAVDASWPTRAKEPYRIATPFTNGPLDSEGIKEVTLSVDVFAAGNDVDEVLLDASNLGFASLIPLSSAGGTKWETPIKNTNLKPVGAYKCMIKASTASSTKYLYNYFRVNIIEPPKSLNDDVQPIFDTYCTSCHGSAGPPLGLDLSEGNTWLNTVNVNSSQSTTTKRIFPGQPQQSYLVAKLKGIQENPPYNGSGDRMPKTGPPYLTEDEMNVITLWIQQGAANN